MIYYVLFLLYLSLDDFFISAKKRF
uniref:Uncharacterized protein n=1 Tax=Arundo donax TaxID=35708 RepID=A0A0A8Y2F3_ARUDO